MFRKECGSKGMHNDSYSHCGMVEFNETTYQCNIAFSRQACLFSLSIILPLFNRKCFTETKT